MLAYRGARSTAPCRRTGRSTGAVVLHLVDVSRELASPACVTVGVSGGGAAGCTSLTARGGTADGTGGGTTDGTRGGTADGTTAPRSAHVMVLPRRVMRPSLAHALTRRPTRWRFQPHR